ncbi:N-acetylglucosaminyl-diphospho-decaprenol L-rhamnosyltransferase [Massilia sp. Bi118]|uniref:glycosyltransferase n=1 Tax=Massilia sp. Bi118 TaxID=2822346 RepID=UPI001DB0882B|nr:glycosyltransferase family 2 protein [Massilia sp. Bi118]CAH0212783.1 N-acetylglucosaminyl-diphospho-decaprenol L-rhamnosyltransferase [Massilia sp. Bi118]
MDERRKTSMNPPASCAIVCRRQRPEQVERLLAGITTGRPGLLVYLIEQGPVDTLRALAGRFGAHYRHQRENPGHARTHNLALREAIAAGSAYHFILNPEIQIPLDGIGKLLAYMEQHPDVGLLAPRVHYPDGRLRPLCKLLPHPLELLVRRFFPLLHRSSGRLARYELHGSGYTRVMDVPALSGCFLLMRLETVQRVGLFDERFFQYFEDVDLSRRVGRIARTVFVPHVAVVHEDGSSYRDWPMLWHRLVSGARYFNKWGWLRDAERARVNARALRAANPARAAQPGARPARTDVSP